MPADHSKLPILELNKYLLQELYTAGVMKETDYLKNNIQYKPIVPVQQNSDFNTLFAGKPYVIYTTAPLDYNDDQFFNCYEQALYTVNATNFFDVLKVQNVILDLYRRLDLSARDLNQFMASDSPFRFHFVRLVETQPQEPQETPQGFYRGYIMIEYRYARKILANGRFAS